MSSRKTPPDVDNADVRDLILGKAEPPNATIEYLVERARSAQAEASVATRNLESAKQAIRKNEIDLVASRGRMDGYAEDIGNWLKKSQEEEKE